VQVKWLLEHFNQITRFQIAVYERPPPQKYPVTAQGRVDGEQGTVGRQATRNPRAADPMRLKPAPPVILVSKDVDEVQVLEVGWLKAAMAGKIGRRATLVKSAAYDPKRVKTLC